MNEEAVIRVRGLTKSYSGVPVLERLDLEVWRGETVVILGRSGSGKSVLLKHMNALLRPDAGSVTVLGHEISGLKESELVDLRRHVGMLFQGGAMFDSLSVADNVAFAFDEHRICEGEERRRRVSALLELVGLSGTQEKMPSELSGGMRKRAALARTLALEPQVLLYDEPTTGLDPVTATQINGLIRDLQAKFGLTSVVVTHDLASACVVGDRIAFLADGAIRQVGSVEEMVASGDRDVQAFFRSGASARLHGA